MPDAGPSVDVVVPIHGGLALARECLTHLAAQTIAHRVIVVDDASPDDTAGTLRTEFPGADHVALPTNSGFAAACNRGIAEGGGDIVILVNSDVNADPGMLAALAEALEREPTAGSAVALLRRPDGSTDSFGISADVTIAGFVRFAGAPVAPTGAEPVLLGPYGAVAAYRRSALDAVGVLDERIFMYGEELDLALRLRDAGWSSVAVPTATGVHVGGASSGRGSPRQRYLAGFGRGYLLRVYGVLRSRHALRAIVTEVIVALSRIVLSRDLESARGRVAGWAAGKSGPRRRVPAEGIDHSIGLVRSLTMRKPSYWA